VKASEVLQDKTDKMLCDPREVGHDLSTQEHNSGHLNPWCHVQRTGEILLPKAFNCLNGKVQW